MLAFSDSIQHIFHLGTVRFDKAELDEAITLFRSPEVQSSLLTQLDSLHVPCLPQFEVARDVFAARRYKSHHQRFNAWFDRTLYRTIAPEHPPEDLFERRNKYLKLPASLMHQFGYSKGHQIDLVSRVFNRIAERYLKHYLWIHPFTSTPTLGRYLTLINLHLLLARFLFISSLDDSKEAQQLTESQIEDQAIGSFQILAKVIFHVTDFSLLLEHYLVEQGFLELNRSVILLPADAQ